MKRRRMGTMTTARKMEASLERAEQEQVRERRVHSHTPPPFLPPSTHLTAICRYRGGPWRVGVGTAGRPR